MIKMRLDTEGLRAMIANNPEIEMEIGREVINNIQMDSIKGKIEGQITACLRGMVQSSGGWNPTYSAKSPEMIQAVKAAAESLINAVLSDKLDGIIATRVESALRIERDYLIRDVKKLMLELVTPDMARDIMREKILL
jgi:DNA-binding FrmR family transcriptional regulator